MTVEVLVAAMNQKDHSLIEKMNIQTNAIVGNQCDYNSIEKFMYDGHDIMYLNFSERGVGLNRNNALMRANADICLLADDDMVYVDGYEKVVIQAFENNPRADIIIFNLEEPVKIRPQIKKTHRVWYFNYLRYGSARIAFRLSRIKENGIYFNQCFGGGTEHCHGEDNLFLNACLKNKLVIKAVNVTIASLTEERDSSWEIGYNHKFFVDQGILYKQLSRFGWKILCLQDAVRHRRLYGQPFYQVFREMIGK